MSRPLIVVLKNENNLMNMRSRQLLAILGGVLTVVSASATERYFTYSYEPETMPRGGWEVEQWATLLAGRNAAAGQDDFQQRGSHHAPANGVTGNYTDETYVTQ